MRILITEPKGYSQKAIELYQKIGEVVLFDGELHDLKLILPSIDVLVIKLKYTWTDSLLNAASSLKYIVTSTTGLNHIEITDNSNFNVISLKGELDFLKTVTPTAELTWALLLSVMRNIPAAVNSVSNGVWNRDLFVGNELFGKTIGIVGYGRLGSMVGQYATAFGMQVKVYDVDHSKLINLPNGIEFLELNSLLSICDVITIHIPLERDTVNFIDECRLSLIKKSAVIINTSRGEVVDESYLLRMLESDLISGVGLDVLSDEVSGISDWVMSNELLKSKCLTKNLIITPHLGGACFDSMNRTELYVAERLVSELNNSVDLKGEPNA
ncbi:3-phosphoglycerate dehydrogenase [Shewanella colwelliana]|uniref:3-phosphoglycerate dehydrogenase n=1 Tax=Shewanella colwelliana TaxID=23 RepID=A0ABQ4P7B1_SHECO|nr:NAD(P)-dependent oxidoreductase [Shewanella colwelliana]GIU43385.1 3-phosphoglycerate dehydrogenase [Shewanella colwelliana]